MTSPDNVLEHAFAIWQHPYLLSLLAMHEVFQPVEICNYETWRHCSTYKQRVGNLQCQNKCKAHNEMFVALFRSITMLCGTDITPCKQMQGAQWNVHNISYIHNLVSCGTISIPCSIYEYSPHLVWMWGILRGIPFVPHNIILKLYNVMWKLQRSTKRKREVVSGRHKNSNTV